MFIAAIICLALGAWLSLVGAYVAMQTRRPVKAWALGLFSLSSYFVLALIAVSA